MHRKMGFTLVEIMIVVAIIGLLAAIAVPSFLKARETARRNACINNLSKIEAAKQEYVLEYGGGPSVVLAQTNVAIYLQDTNKCYCPVNAGAARTMGLSYAINALTSNPTCMSNDVDAAGAVWHSLKYSGK